MAELFDLSVAWVVITVAVLVAAFTKGATGLGFPLIAVPIAAVFLGVEHAVVVIALPNVVSSLWVMGTFRRAAPSGPALPMLLAGGAVGAVVGTLLLRAAPDRALALAMGLLVVGYVTLRIASPSLVISDRTILRTAPGVGLVGGVLHGATGMSGPVIATYVHSWRLDRAPFLFALSAAFGLFTLAQIVTFVPAGLYTPTRLVQSVAALVPTLLAVPLGIRAARRMDTMRFERLVLLVMVAMGLRLLATGFGFGG